MKRSARQWLGSFAVLVNASGKNAEELASSIARLGTMGVTPLQRLAPRVGLLPTYLTIMLVLLSVLLRSAARRTPGRCLLVRVTSLLTRLGVRLCLLDRLW